MKASVHARRASDLSERELHTGQNDEPEARYDDATVHLSVSQWLVRKIDGCWAFICLHGPVLVQLLPWSLSVPDRPQYRRLRSGVCVCRSITAAMKRVLLTGRGQETAAFYRRSPDRELLHRGGTH